MTTNSEIMFDTVYRNAFPRYKVFVYGKEISADVVSVRINQAGGSIERTPSSCSITLVNKAERYTITHEDMYWIGRSRRAIIEGQADSMDYSIAASSYDPALPGSEYSNPYLGYIKYTDSGLVDSGDRTKLDPLLAKKFKGFSSSALRELAGKLALASDSEKVIILQSIGTSLTDDSGLFGLSEEEAVSLSAQLNNSIQSSSAISISSAGIVDEMSKEDFVDYNIKREVVTNKLNLTHTYNIENFVARDDKNAVSAMGMDDGVNYVFDYPYQEGDCIFHPNDPVRVAFRDPFDPRIWYWMFSGYVDSWTEDVSSELESSITLSCTDVTKSARYAVTNVNPGLNDPEISNILSTFFNSSLASLRAVPEEFANLSLFEIIELIFFGSISLKKAVEAKKLLTQEMIAEITKFIKESDLSDDDKVSFLIAKYGFTLEEIYVETTVQGFGKPNLNAINFSNAFSNITQMEGVIGSASQLNWTGISGPRDVRLKAKSADYGVYFYTFGTPSVVDQCYGAVTVSDFNEWNEILHHRVRQSDLITMCRLDRGSFNNYSSNTPSEKIVDIIGSDLDKYPVGGGRVFYFAPAGMERILGGTGIVNQVAGFTNTFNSAFKDRLSMMYDVTDAIEFRFYATPKGDIVVEHPFYDYDPQDFFKNGNVSITTPSFESATLSQYEKTFGQLYSGNYSAEDVQTLSDMIFSLNADDRMVLDFEKSLLEANYDYANTFVIGIDDQLNFSNTGSDKGVVTLTRGQLLLFRNYSNISTSGSLESKVYVVIPQLIPMLGWRMHDDNFKMFIPDVEEAVYSAALRLNQINAEARTLGIDSVPKFGLMVNRPIYWKYRNAYATVVSCTHSIVWNSDAVTNINVNQIRGWSGEFDQNNRPRYKHFGNSDNPFNFKNLFVKKTKTMSKSGADN